MGFSTLIKLFNRTMKYTIYIQVKHLPYFQGDPFNANISIYIKPSRIFFYLNDLITEHLFIFSLGNEDTKRYFKGYSCFNVC